VKHLLLKILSLFYGLIVSIRNEMFDLKILPSYEFDLPVISVGNITVGGTGKTPHTEYIINLLRSSLKVAALSRGYKRKTKGFFVVEPGSTVRQVGDEPLQIKQKFSDAIVAVDAKRVRGIKKLMNLAGKPEVIVLDDAFQHRYVTPGMNILLTDYTRLITKDSLLPYGRLRESASNRDRANIIIVTKCPSELKPIDERIITKELFIRPYQYLYFTRLEYGTVRPVYPEDVQTEDNDLIDGTAVLLLAGIANPLPLKEYLIHRSHNILEINFPDHHNYTLKDLDDVIAKFKTLPEENRLIITTEKDMVRIRDIKNVPDIIRKNLYYIPLTISFLNDGGKDFDRKIMNYVRENKSNFELHLRKNKI
jgi:tetraacyldisaccharide 4'-kinase